MILAIQMLESALLGLSIRILPMAVVKVIDGKRGDVVSLEAGGCVVHPSRHAV